MARQRTISAADANRSFSQVLRAVRTGRSFIVTAHGRAVARIVPIEAPDAVAASARRTLLTRLESSSVTQSVRWSRDELYDE